MGKGVGENRWKEEMEFSSKHGGPFMLHSPTLVGGLFMALVGDLR